MTAKKPQEGVVLKTRFAQVPEWVALHPAILKHPTALAAYVHLFLLGDFKARITTSDWRELSDVTGWSKPTVMRAMKVLRDAGVVVREGADLRLPMDLPGIKSDTEAPDLGIKSDTGPRQIRDPIASDVRPPPFSTENSEVPHSVDAVASTDIRSLCDLLSEEVGRYLGDPIKAPAVTARWTNDMRLLLEKGPLHRAKSEVIAPDRVRRCIRVVFDELAEPTGSRGFCWAAQIRSPGALRDHWDQVAEAAKQSRATGSNGKKDPLRRGLPSLSDLWKIAEGADQQKELTP